MAEYVKFSVPEDLKTLQADVVSKISKSGKIKIGINEVTKTIERNIAKLVIIAEDISPAEIVMHVPVICKEKNIPFTYVSTKEELGKIVGISAKASSVSITDEGVAKKEFSALINKIEEISGVVSKKAEVVKPEKEVKAKVAEKKEKSKDEPKDELKKEAPKEEVKEEPKKEEAPKEVKEEPKKEEAPKEVKEEPKKEEASKEVKEEAPKEVKEEPKKEEAPKEVKEEAPKEVKEEAPKEEEPKKE
jgi:large subunit ribosomal protein L7Ae